MRRMEAHANDEEILSGAVVERLHAQLDAITRDMQVAGDRKDYMQVLKLQAKLRPVREQLSYEQTGNSQRELQLQQRLEVQLQLDSLTEDMKVAGVQEDYLRVLQIQAQLGPLRAQLKQPHNTAAVEEVLRDLEQADSTLQDDDSTLQDSGNADELPKPSSSTVAKVPPLSGADQLRKVIESISRAAMQDGALANGQPPPMGKAAARNAARKVAREAALEAARQAAQRAQDAVQHEPEHAGTSTSAQHGVAPMKPSKRSIADAAIKDENAKDPVIMPNASHLAVETAVNKCLGLKIETVASLEAEVAGLMNRAEMVLKGGKVKKVFPVRVGELLASKKTKLSELMKDWDVNADGNVSKQEFRLNIRKMFEKEKADAREIDLLFAAIDEDKSGKLELQEVTAAMKKLKDAASNAKGQMATAKEQAGAINEVVEHIKRVIHVTKRSEEAKEQLETMRNGTVGSKLGDYINIKNMKVAELVVQWDKSSSGEITKKVFRAHVMTICGAEAAEVDELFDSLDDDGGGSLDRTELMKALKRLQMVSTHRKDEVRDFGRYFMAAFRASRAAQRELRRLHPVTNEDAEEEVVDPAPAAAPKSKAGGGSSKASKVSEQASSSSPTKNSKGKKGLSGSTLQTKHESVLGATTNRKQQVDKRDAGAMAQSHRSSASKPEAPSLPGPSQNDFMGSALQATPLGWVSPYHDSGVYKLVRVGESLFMVASPLEIRATVKVDSMAAGTLAAGARVTVLDQVALVDGTVRLKIGKIASPSILPAALSTTPPVTTAELVADGWQQDERRPDSWSPPKKATPHMVVPSKANDTGAQTLALHPQAIANAPSAALQNVPDIGGAPSAPEDGASGIDYGTVCQLLEEIAMLRELHNQVRVSSCSRVIIPATPLHSSH